jgi:hypothetical protein
MLAVLIGVVGALSGTIVGSLLTQVLQRRNAAAGRLHEARIDAYGSFAAAVMDYRKALMDRWYINNESRAAPVGHDVYAMRSAVWAAYFQVLLVAGDTAIVRRAEQARDLTTSVKEASTRTELDDRGDVCRVAVGQFAEAARYEVSPTWTSRRRKLRAVVDNS